MKKRSAFERLESRAMLASVAVTSPNAFEIRPAGDLNRDGIDDALVWTHDDGHAYLGMIWGDADLASHETIHVEPESVTNSDGTSVGESLLLENILEIQPRFGTADFFPRLEGGIREPHGHPDGINFLLRDGRTMSLKFLLTGDRIGAYRSPSFGFGASFVLVPSQAEVTTDFNGDGVQDRIDGGTISFGTPIGMPTVTQAGFSLDGQLVDLVPAGDFNDDDVDDIAVVAKKAGVGYIGIIYGRKYLDLDNIEITPFGVSDRLGNAAGITINVNRVAIFSDSKAADQIFQFMAPTYFGDGFQQAYVCHRGPELNGICFDRRTNSPLILAEAGQVTNSDVDVVGFGSIEEYEPWEAAVPTDFNGDGAQDRITRRGIVFGNPPDSGLPTHGSITVSGEGPLELRPAGDFNRDGIDDALVWTQDNGDGLIALIYGREDLDEITGIHVGFRDVWSELGTLGPWVEMNEIALPDGGFLDQAPFGIREPNAFGSGIQFSTRDGREFFIKEVDGQIVVADPADEEETVPTTDLNADGLQDRFDNTRGLALQAEIIFGQSGRRSRRISLRADRLL